MDILTLFDYETDKLHNTQLHEFLTWYKKLTNDQGNYDILEQKTDDGAFTTVNCTDITILEAEAIKNKVDELKKQKT